MSYPSDETGLELLLRAIRKLYAEGKSRAEITQSAVDWAWIEHKTLAVKPVHKQIKY